MEKYLFLLITIVVTATSQIALKMTIGQLMPQLPEMNSFTNLLKAAFIVFKNWQILLILLFSALGFFSWFLTLTKFELSHAFPLMAVVYILVLLASWLIFKENISSLRIAGSLLIALGVFLVAKS
ncbi:MAG: EamA family transporter [bacterium]|nr:EamA family transporter [bacterium]